ncbi:MAG: hypothetical protein IPH12_15180 [Saprospirales bacterium]|nr:hypothetical protein [Saprospirales bacterium]
MDVQRAPSEGPREDVPAGLRTPEALKGFSWEFTNLRADDGEKTIFIDVQVPANVSTEINDTSTVQATVFAAIGYDNGSDALDSTGPTVPTDPGSDVVDIAVTKTAAPPPAKQEAPFFDILFGTSKAGADGVADSELENNFEEVYDFYREEMSPVAINYASDPNFILWHPLMLPPGAMNETLSYEVHFQNDGSASADGDDLRVTIGIDPLQNPEGVVPGSSYPACLDIRTFPHVIEWSTKKTLIEDPTCKLNALGDARALGFSEGATWGHVAHTMQTKPGYVFKTGDTIYAQAAVKMGLSEVKTDVSKIPVGIPAFCSQGFFGLKFAYHLANDEHRSGWGLALTARYPLGKVKNPGFEAHLNHAINKKNYPLFWWQGELGYGQTRHRPAMNDSFFVRHIDVSPFVLRFIAKKPPLRIGSVGIQRGWGLSAGYTGSYLFSSQRNGADDTSFERMSFTDRLDHSLSVTADFLNLIGQPGLSLEPDTAGATRKSAASGTGIPMRSSTCTTLSRIACARSSAG